jgi:hypothetical protein
MPETNVTFVTMLTYNPEDRIPPIQRLDWLRPLFASKVPLHLFVDSYFEGLLDHISDSFHPDLHIRPWRIEDSATWKLCQVYSGPAPLRLPTSRFTQKDSSYFLTLMHTKAELVATIAAEELAEEVEGRPSAPFLAFIDAGIHKIFKEPEESWNRLASLRLRKGWHGALLPGCWQPAQRGFQELADRINWSFCGGFFVVPTEDATAFWGRQTEALLKFLERGFITWEVNTWVYSLSLPNPSNFQFHWFEADHNDRMTMVPADKLEN